MMNCRKLIYIMMLMGTMILAVSCGNNQVEVSDLYDDIYEVNTEYSLQTKQQIIDRFAEAGLSAVDIDNQINMVNWEIIGQFCSKTCDDQAVIYVINDDGSYTQYNLLLSDNNLHVKMQVCTGGETSTVSYQNEYDAAYWDYTDKGYLFFGSDHPTGDFGSWLETTIRVKPMDENLRKMTQEYLNVLGYEDNNVFIENWNESDFTAMELYDLYEVLTGNIDAVNEPVPTSEFEAVVKKYLNISSEEIRSLAEYDSAADVYYFSSRTAEVKGSTPDMPYPEVVSVTDNGDGTLTLLVEAVWPKYKEDKAFVHEVTVRPQSEGFKYVSNKIIDDKMGTKWYVGR